jgi:tRNA 2-thiouridine synthesizing protein A
MAEVIDARGLSCPQPVILTVEAIKAAGQGELTVLVDTDTAKENVSRATNAQGWKVMDVQPVDEGYRIKIGK